MANEKRLIYADALKQKATYMYGFGQNKYVPLKAIENAHTVDAVEVVHGRWRYDNTANFWNCSCCGVNAPIHGDFLQLKTNYCSNCGAKMDKEE